MYKRAMHRLSKLSGIPSIGSVICYLYPVIKPSNASILYPALGPPELLSALVSGLLLSGGVRAGCGHVPFSRAVCGVCVCLYGFMHMYVIRNVHKCKISLCCSRSCS